METTIVYRGDIEITERNVETTIMEPQIEKNMENDMETGMRFLFCWGLWLRDFGSGLPDWGAEIQGFRIWVPGGRVWSFRFRVWFNSDGLSLKVRDVDARGFRGQIQGLQLNCVPGSGFRHCARFCVGFGGLRVTRVFIVIHTWGEMGISRDC